MPEFLGEESHVSRANRSGRSPSAGGLQSAKPLSRRDFHENSSNLNTYKATLWVIGARGEWDGVDPKPKTIPSLSLSLSLSISLSRTRTHAHTHTRTFEHGP